MEEVQAIRCMRTGRESGGGTTSPERWVCRCATLYIYVAYWYHEMGGRMSGWRTWPSQDGVGCVARPSPLSRAGGEPENIAAHDAGTGHAAGGQLRPTVSVA